MRVNKYLYGWKFYCHYGQGWEYEIFEETYSGMKENRKGYRAWLIDSLFPCPMIGTQGNPVNAR